MKTVVVIGTPLAGIETIWSILEAAGVEAIPSSEGVDIAQWHRKVIDVYAAKDKPIADQSIHPGKIWEHRLIAMLNAGMDKAVIGWCDPLSFCLLDYWRSLDSSIHFVLLYESPVEALVNSLSEAPSREESQAIIADWQTATTRLLRFYNRNQDVALLVESNLCQQNPKQFLELFNDKFKLNLSTTAKPGLLEESKDIKRVLAREILGDCASCWDLYRETFTSASLSLSQDSIHNLPHKAWSLFQELIQKTHSQQQEIVSLQAQKLQIEKGAKKKLPEPEVEQEIELLTLQLRHAQEELEHYFSLYQETQATSRTSNGTVLPWFGNIKINMDERLDGDNWYTSELAESFALRWTGPGKRTTLNLSIRRDIEQLLVIHYRQTVTPEQLAGLRIEIDGVHIEHEVHARYPSKSIYLKVPIREDRQGDSSGLAIILPKMVSDQEINPKSTDRRPLGLAVYGIYSFPFKPKLKVDCTKSWFSRMFLIFLAWRKRVSLSSYPIAYFDGLGYLKAHPEVAELVVKGKISSALSYHLKNTLHKEESLYLPLTDSPVEGDNNDLNKLRVIEHG